MGMYSVDVGIYVCIDIGEDMRVDMDVNTGVDMDVCKQFQILSVLVFFLLLYVLNIHCQ